MATRSLIASLLGLACTLGACSSLSPEADQPVDTQVTSTTIADELAFVDESDPDATLHLALTRPATWDPASLVPADQNAVILADLLYDGLTEASTVGTLRPGLALSWDSNPDFTEWTFDLDPGRITAEQVVASFERMRGLQPDSAAVLLLRDVDSIVATGQHQVVFTLRNPHAGFAWLLSGVSYSVVGENAAHTGRYAVTSDDPVSMNLASAEYGDITVSWFEDGDAAYQQLTLGQVEAAVVDPASSRDAANRFGQQPSARSIVRFYGLNLASEDLWDPRVREAALVAIDRPAVLAELPTAGFTADGVAAATTAGFRHGACNTACIYNPGESRALLDDAGSTPSLKIVYSGPGQAGVAAEISTSLRAGGFDTEVVEVDAAQMPEMIADGSAEIFAFGWVAPAGSMDAVVPPLFASTSPLNVTRLVSVEVDDLIEQAMRTRDDVTRWGLLAEAHEAALAQWVVIPVAVAHNGLVQSPDLSPLAVRADGSIDPTSIE